MAEEYRTLYGQPIAPARKFPIRQLERHPQNPKRKMDRDENRLFRADIKSQGVDKVCLVIKIPDALRKGEALYWVLRGWRRVEAAEAAEEKTIMAEEVIGRLDPKNAKERVILRQLIFKDNFMRASYTDEELEDLILSEYGEARIMLSLSGGSEKTRSERQLLPLDRVIEQELGMKAETAKMHLASLRRKINERRAADSRQSLTEDEERTGLSMARRWHAAQSKIDRANKSIERIKTKLITPLKKEQKDLARELRKIGGLERHLKRIK